MKNYWKLALFAIPAYLYWSIWQADNLKPGPNAKKLTPDNFK